MQSHWRDKVSEREIFSVAAALTVIPTSPPWSPSSHVSARAGSYGCIRGSFHRHNLRDDIYSMWRGSAVHSNKCSSIVARSIQWRLEVGPSCNSGTLSMTPLCLLLLLSHRKDITKLRLGCLAHSQLTHSFNESSTSSNGPQ